MPRYIRFIGFLHYEVYVLNQAKSLDESVQLLLTVCTVLSSPMLCLPWRPLFPLFSWKLLCSALVFIGPTTPNLRSLSFIVNDYIMMCHSSPCSSYYIRWCSNNNYHPSPGVTSATNMGPDDPTFVTSTQT